MHGYAVLRLIFREVFSPVRYAGMALVFDGLA
jgi:hypothetical protein